MASRPAYSTLKIDPTAPRAAAIRIVTRTRPTLLDGPTVDAWTVRVDDEGREIGHRSGPMTLEAARRLADRQASYYSLRLEAAT